MTLDEVVDSFSSFKDFGENVYAEEEWEVEGREMFPMEEEEEEEEGVVIVVTEQQEASGGFVSGSDCNNQGISEEKVAEEQGLTLEDVLYLVCFEGEGLFLDAI